MTFRKLGQGLLATTVSAGIGLGLTSCGQSSTVDFLYLASAFSSPGVVNAYKVDSQTGALTQVSKSPFTVGNDPVGLVASPVSQTLYVINHDDNTVEMLSVGDDASLTKINTYTTPGNAPVAVAINPTGTLLFVVDTFANGTSGPGGLVVYPITKGSGSDASLGTPVTQTLPSMLTAGYYPLGNTPTAVNVLSNGNTVYVTDQLTAPAAGCTTGQGAVVALSVSSAGTLTPVTGSPFCAGVRPSSIASHPIGNYVYVTDSTQDQLIGYVVESSGALIPFVGGPVGTGLSPSSVVVEPRGLYMYVANHGNNSAGLQSYSIAAGTGVPSSTGTYKTDAFPQCVIVEPALARFVYTADFEGIGATGYQLDPNTGILTGTENSPYPGAGLSTCLAAISHGNHPTIHVQGEAGS